MTTPRSAPRRLNRTAHNALTADRLRECIAPTVAELNGELAKRIAEPALARMGTRMLIDALLQMAETSAECVHVEGAGPEDTLLMPLSTKLMAACIYGHAGGLELADLERVLRAVWDRAADMGIIPTRGH